MNNPRLWKQWGIVTALLEDARRYLVSAPKFAEHGSTSLIQFDEYLAHNELGLALEEMASLGRGMECKAMFWRELQQAAQVMELNDVAEEFHQEFLATVARK